MATEYLNNKVLEANVLKYQRAERLKARYRLMIEDTLDANHRKSLRNGKPNGARLDVDTALLMEAMKESRESLEILTKAFYVLAENIVGYTKFSLIDYDEAIQEAVLICLEKIHKFDTSKGKAFNYLTTIIWNGIRQTYRGAKTYNEIKKKYHEFLQNREENVIIRNGKESRMNK